MILPVFHIWWDPLIRKVDLGAKCEPCPGSTGSTATGGVTKVCYWISPSNHHRRSSSFGSCWIFQQDIHRRVPAWPFVFPHKCLSYMLVIIVITMIFAKLLVHFPKINHHRSIEPSILDHNVWDPEHISRKPVLPLLGQSRAKCPVLSLVAREIHRCSWNQIYP